MGLEVEQRAMRDVIFWNHTARVNGETLWGHLCIIPHSEFSVRTSNWQNLSSSSPGCASYSIYIFFSLKMLNADKKLSEKKFWDFFLHCMYIHVPHHAGDNENLAENSKKKTTSATFVMWMNKKTRLSLVVAVYSSCNILYCDVYITWENVFSW